MRTVIAFCSGEGAQCDPSCNLAAVIRRLEIKIEEAAAQRGIRVLWNPQPESAAHVRIRVTLVEPSNSGLRWVSLGIAGRARVHAKAVVFLEGGEKRLLQFSSQTGWFASAFVPVGLSVSWVEGCVDRIAADLVNTLAGLGGLELPDREPSGAGVPAAALAAEPVSAAISSAPARATVPAAAPPSYPRPPAPDESDGFGVAAMILGIVCLPVSLIPCFNIGFIGLVCAAVAIWFGLVGKSGMATTGLILGLVAAFGWCVGFLVMFDVIPAPWRWFR
jgi:hypothetical protein